MGHPEVDFNPINGAAEQLAQQLDGPEQDDALRQGAQSLGELAIVVKSDSAFVHSRYTTDGTPTKPGQVWPARNPNLELREAETIERLTQD